jgi:hypothetical protein
VLDGGRVLLQGGVNQPDCLMSPPPSADW